MSMDKIERDLLEQITGLHDVPQGAYNIRAIAQAAGRNDTDLIHIVSKTDKPGIDIIIAPGTKNESVHIPVVLSQSGLKDLVYNDFYVGEGADVTIVAGCGVHTETGEPARHNGIHRFFLKPGSRVLYQEKHIGTGKGAGLRSIDPVTEAYLEENAVLEMDTAQIGGVDHTLRKTKATAAAGAKLRIRERILTEGEQDARTEFEVELAGEGSGADIVSRAVARGKSHQEYGDAALIHEAAIGKIAGEQILKLRTLGLTEQEAEARIIEGFLS